MATENIVTGWLRACPQAHRQRLARRLALLSGPERHNGLDALAATLLAECAADLELEPCELASLIGDPRKTGREAVLELALTGLGSPLASAA
jgi:hypothetical protein